MQMYTPSAFMALQLHHLLKEATGRRGGEIWLFAWIDSVRLARNELARLASFIRASLTVEYPT